MCAVSWGARATKRLKMRGEAWQEEREREGRVGSTGGQAIFKAREARAGSHLGACVEPRQREGREAGLWSPHARAFDGPSTK